MYMESTSTFKDNDNESFSSVVLSTQGYGGWSHSQNKMITHAALSKWSNGYCQNVLHTSIHLVIVALIGIDRSLATSRRTKFFSLSLLQTYFQTAELNNMKINYIINLIKIN